MIGLKLHWQWIVSISFVAVKRKSVMGASEHDISSRALETTEVFRTILHDFRRARLRLVSKTVEAEVEVWRSFDK